MRVLGGTFAACAVIAAVVVAVVAAVVVAGAGPAAAHVGERGELPLPFHQLAWAALAAIVVSFAALVVAWRRPILAAAASGRTLPARLSTALDVVAMAARGVVLVLFVTVVAAGLAGTDRVNANLAPVTVLVMFWVGVPILSVVLGDVWRAVSPFETIAAGIERIRPGPGAGSESRGARDLGHWWAVPPLLGFGWLLLAFHDGSRPRVIGWAAVAYTVWLGAGTWRRGREWMRSAEGFGVLFGLVAAMAPFARDARGRIRLRAPLSGLALVRASGGTLAVLVVVLGATAFDGLSGSQVWADLAGSRSGWDATAVDTVGLLASIAVVGAVFLGATRAIAPVDRSGPVLGTDFAPALVPVVVAYVVAHYFSLLVVEGQQRFRILASDPLGRGWDLFGTATGRIDFEMVSATVVTWVQVAVIVVGHVAGVVVAHDRALERTRAIDAGRSQYPLLVAMVIYAVGGLWLLLSA